MQLPINPDPQSLNKNVFGGRKWWQYLCIVIAFAIAVVFTIFMGPRLSGSMNGFVCAVLVVPIGYIGVFQKNGLNFFEYYKIKRASGSGGNMFLYFTEPVKTDCRDDAVIERVRGRRKKENG